MQHREPCVRMAVTPVVYTVEHCALSFVIAAAKAIEIHSVDITGWTNFLLLVLDKPLYLSRPQLPHV